MLPKNLLDFIDMDKSDIDKICSNVEKKTKLRARPRCFFALIPSLSIFHVFYAAVLKEVSKTCDTYILLHDHLSPILFKSTSTEAVRDWKALISAFNIKCNLVLGSAVLQQVYFEDEFIKMISFIHDFKELVEKIGELTAAKISGDLHSMMAWAAEFYVASVWFPKERRMTIDFALFGADRYPLYNWARETLLKTRTMCPDFMCVRHLFGMFRRPLFVNVNMTSTEIADCILRSTNNSGAVETILNDIRLVSDFISASLGLSDVKAPETLDIDPLSVHLSQIFQTIRNRTRFRPAAEKKEPAFHPFGWRSIKPSELDKFCDLLKSDVSRSLLKLVYGRPGMRQSDYQKELRKKYLAKKEKRKRRAKTISAATISGYFRRAEKLQLLTKEAKRWYPSHKSIELRLSREFFERYE